MKKKIIDITPIFRGVVIGVYVFIFITGLTRIYNGYHTFDMGQNIEFLAYQEDINLSEYYETTSAGNTLSIQSMYRKGLNQCIDGLAMIITNFFIALAYMLLTISKRED